MFNLFFYKILHFWNYILLTTPTEESSENQDEEVSLDNLKEEEITSSEEADKESTNN